MNIVFNGIDGTVAIMTLAPGADKLDAIKKFHEAHPGKYADEHFENVTLPKDRTNRDRWTMNKAGRIVVRKLSEK